MVTPLTSIQKEELLKQGFSQEVIGMMQTALTPKWRELRAISNEQDIPYTTAHDWAMGRKNDVGLVLVQPKLKLVKRPNKEFVRGGSRIYVDEDEFLDLMRNRPRVGRPKKITVHEWISKQITP